METLETEKKMFSKKLLITLGCSFTEGVGCYIPELLKDNQPIVPRIKIHNASVDRFHTMGWPTQLQKKLQYDCLYNLGRGGASNSQIVKQWFERFSNTNLSTEYEVLVVWLVTFSNRISFYRDGVANSLLPVTNTNPDRIDVYKNLYESYIAFLGNDYKKDMILEMYFYVNIIKTICDLSNYKFLYLNIDQEEGILLDRLMKSNASLNFLHKKYYPTDAYPFTKGDNLAFCGHLNEKGYEVLAERMSTMIKNEYPELVNTEHEPMQYEMKYLGAPKQW